MVGRPAGGEPLGAVLVPWRCAGALRSGRPCLRLLAHVDADRPMYIKATCPRCGHENTLVEPYRAREPAPAARSVLG